MADELGQALGWVTQTKMMPAAQLKRPKSLGLELLRPDVPKKNATSCSHESYRRKCEAPRKAKGLVLFYTSFIPLLSLLF